MPYNKITGKGKPSKTKGEDNTTGKGVRRLTEEQIKELLELLKTDTAAGIPARCLYYNR